MTMLRRLTSLPVCLLLFVVAGPVSVARASYPGRAGEVVYQDSYSSTDPLNGGATEFDYSLRAASPSASGTSRRVSCQGFDSGFQSGATQFCPESGVGFSPDGRTVVFAGAEFQADGSSVPDQNRCDGVGSCPRGLILAAADGSAPRLVPLSIFDAKEPAFMPDGHTLVFAGRTRLGDAFDLYTVRMDGTGLTRVTSDGGTDPAPCANGSIVYVHRKNLFLLSADLLHRRRLTARGGTLPDCSRDSRAIVFLRRSTLYTINTTGRHLRRLSSLGVADGRPAFAPTGGEIAFTTTRRCASHCGEHFSHCVNLTDRLELIDLLGRRRRSYTIGSNQCSSDGDLGGDTPGDAAWQPLPAAGT